MTMTPEQETQAKRVVDGLLDDDANFALATAALNVFETAAREAGLEELTDPEVVVGVLVALGSHMNGWELERRLDAFRQLGSDLAQGAERIADRPAPMTVEEVDTLWSEHTQGAKPGEGVA